MHHPRRLPLLLLFAALPLAAQQAGPLENGTNRPGGDFRDFAMAAPDPAACQAACVGDASCRSFTYVKPGAQGPQAHCWLKANVPPANADANCVSGVVQRAAPQAGDLEQSVNRPGGDYRSFPVPSANPGDCRAACNAETVCRSFTFVKPGAQGPQAVCWLKNTVPPGHPDNNCVSGLAVHAGGGPTCGQCAATTCAAVCHDVILLLCVAGATTKNDGVACQRCIDSCAPH
jgi:hypothetical protein